MLIIALLSSLAHADPEITGGVGAELFGPISGFRVNPALSGQAEFHGLHDSIPTDLGLAASVLLGMQLPYCQGCGAFGDFRIGVGPIWRFGDIGAAGLQGRLACFTGSSFACNVQPALIGHVNVGAGPVVLQPFVGLNGLRYLDYEVGVRVKMVATDGPPRFASNETSLSSQPPIRTRTCTEGDTREVEGQREHISFSGPYAAAPIIDIEPHDVGYYDPDSRKALKGLSDALGMLLLSKSVANVAWGAKTAAQLGKQGADEAAGVAVTTGGYVAGNKLSEQASKDIGGEISIQVGTSPVEVPIAMVANYAAIGERAIGAVERWREAARDKQGFTVTARAVMAQFDYDCYAVQVCTDGRWVNGGVHPTEVVLTGLPEWRSNPIDVNFRSEIVHATGQLNTAFKQQGSTRAMLARQGIGLCELSRDFSPEDLEFPPDEPPRTTCGELRTQLDELKQERRSWTGISPELELESGSFRHGQASADCEWEQQSFDYYDQRTADRQKLLDEAEPGSATAEVLQRQVSSNREMANEARQRLSDACMKRDELDKKLDEHAERIARREQTIEAIDDRIEEVEKALKNCDE